MKNQTKNTTQNKPPGEGENHNNEAFDKLEAENAELKTAIRLSDARQQLTTALAKAGARSPELLFDAVKGDLMFAEDGRLENEPRLVEQITARFPEQFGIEMPASIDGGAGNGGG